MPARQRTGVGGPRPQRGAEVSAQATPGLPVLLLEENLHLRQLLVDTLRGRGHVITVCEDVETAWEAYQQGHHPIVVLALDAKQGDGLQLGRRIREHPDGPSSVLILVVEHRPAQGLLPLLAVADDCLTKPLKGDVVEMRLAAAERLAHERAERKAAEVERQSLKTRLEHVRPKPDRAPASAVGCAASLLLSGSSATPGREKQTHRRRLRNLPTQRPTRPRRYSGHLWRSLRRRRLSTSRSRCFRRSQRAFRRRDPSSKG
jgi:CheY-like chemotaxis protein